jgi:hypothetical protein
LLSQISPDWEKLQPTDPELIIIIILVRGKLHILKPNILEEGFLTGLKKKNFLPFVLCRCNSSSCGSQDVVVQFT